MRQEHAWGCRGWSEAEWFQLAWNAQSMHLQTSVKKLIPIMIAVMIWGHKWWGYNVVVNCDNEAVVTVLGSQYSREPHLMHML